MNGWGLFFLLLLLLVILPAGAWIGWTRWRAHQQGLPAPPLSAYIPFKSSPSNYPVAPRTGGVVGWVQDKIASIRNHGTGLGSGGRGAGSGAHAGGRGSFSQLDPDGAWDDRVGHEADAHGRIGDYEEQELGMHPSGAQYAGRGDRQAMPSYGQGAVDDMGGSRGRALHRAGDSEDTSYHGATTPAGGMHQATLDQRYAEEMHGVAPEVTNPFGDEAAVGGSMRGVSPRPVTDGQHAAAGHAKKDSGGDSSLKSGRRSMFHEDM